jgi:hypothetical protein
LSQDVGAPRAGAVTYLGNSFTVDAAGADIWGPVDQFRFVYQRVSGDIDITARVNSLKGTQAWTKAGVMIRDSLAATATHASLFLSGGKGVAFQRRTAKGLSSGNTSGPASKAPGWVKLERRGSIITALWSKDSRSWTVIGSDVITLPPAFYVGLAVTSHDNNSMATAIFDHVTVSIPVKQANHVPEVSLIAPVPNALVAAGTTLTVTAEASDEDGAIAGVDFYAGATLLGSDATEPYVFVWKPTVPDVYSLSAVARDNAGATALSLSRTVTIQRMPATEKPPASDKPSASQEAPVDAPPPSVDTLPALKPVRLGFIPSADDAIVSFYRLEIYEAGDLPGKDPAVATHNLGKPTPVSGESIVDIAPVLVPLLSRSYVAVVTAVGTGGGETKSAPSAPFTR